MLTLFIGLAHDSHEIQLKNIQKKREEEPIEMNRYNET
jgi:hypothetical protein